MRPSRTTLLLYDAEACNFDEAVSSLVDSGVWVSELDVRNRLAVVMRPWSDGDGRAPRGWRETDQLPPERLAITDTFTIRGIALFDQVIGVPRDTPACLGTVRTFIGAIPSGSTDLLLSRPPPALHPRRASRRPMLPASEARPATSKQFRARTSGIPGFQVVSETARRLRVRCDSAHVSYLCTGLVGLGWQVHVRFQCTGDVVIVRDERGFTLPLAVQMLANLGRPSEAILAALRENT